MKSLNLKLLATWRNNNKQKNYHFYDCQPT